MPCDVLYGCLHVGMDGTELMDGHDAFANALLIGDDYGYIVFYDGIGEDCKEVRYEGEIFDGADVAAYDATVDDAVTVEKECFIFCSIWCHGIYGQYQQ